MPKRFSRPWFRSGWKLIRSFNAESRGDFARALQLIDEAGEIAPLQAWFWVKRVSLLLRLERVEEAYRWFDDLRQQLKDSPSPERQYLYHYCTAMLSMMQPGPNQWSDEAKQANAISCGWYVKGLLPMISPDELHEGIKPRP
ncbi:MAG: bacterial transcriptional activator domain-containing protein [Sphingomicrobium sp.]